MTADTPTFTITDKGQSAPTPGTEPQQALDAVKAAITAYEAAVASGETPDVAVLLAACAAPLGADAEPARKPWPKGHAVEVKAFPTGKDLRNFTRWAQIAQKRRVEEDGEDLALSQYRRDATVAIAAVMTVRTTGPLLPFDEEETDPVKRISMVDDWPLAMANHVVRVINERMTESPLG